MIENQKKRKFYIDIFIATLIVLIIAGFSTLVVKYCIDHNYQEMNKFSTTYNGVIYSFFFICFAVPGFLGLKLFQ